MKKNQLRASMLCMAMLFASPIAAYAAEPEIDQKKLAAAIIQTQKIIHSSSPDGSKLVEDLPPTAEQMKAYSDMFKRAKMLIDNPKTWDQIPSKVTLCIFSPEGAKGRGFDFAMNAVKDLPKFTQIAKSMGVDLKISMSSPMDMHIDMASAVAKRKASTDVKFRIYTNEKIASEDFKAGQCDGVAMSNLRAKEYNGFIGSLDAIGAIPSYKHLTEAIQLLSNN